MLTAHGAIEGNRLYQAKGRDYTLAELLGETGADVQSLEGGRYFTIYLAPHNYHRVHSPLAARLKRTRYIPGARFSVSRATAAAIPRLFCRNERVVCWFDTDHGTMAVVLVGALNVSSISTFAHGEIASGSPRLMVERPPRAVARGAEIGRFNMGSTVVVLLGTAELALRAGRCRRARRAHGRSARDVLDDVTYERGASLGTLRLRAAMQGAIRSFFAARGVLEVETPALSSAGATDPAIESVTASARSLGSAPQYLHTSPEFAMKRLLAAGSGDIYQLCRVFRDDELGRWHQPEFTLLEWYRVGWDEQRLMTEVAELVDTALAAARSRLGRVPGGSCVSATPRRSSSRSACRRTRRPTSSFGGSRDEASKCRMASRTTPSST